MGKGIKQVRIAIIGTAGRHVIHKMDKTLWNNMISYSREIVDKDWTLVSGGAAWADHIAVHLYLTGHVNNLILHLPAPFDPSTNKYVGGYRTAGGVSSYWHEKFSSIIGRDTQSEVVQAAISDNCTGSAQQPNAAMSALFNRNSLIVKDSEGMIAFTFGENSPINGGTKDTWDKFPHNKYHVSLPNFHLSTF